MQIKNLKVYNFGKITDYYYELLPGCNIICEDNGWGKTTLSSFIRAMFYGFSTKGPNATLRQKYIPWQGGTYGGELTFSDGEKTYTIIRKFGDVKTGKNDIFQLIDEDTKKESKKYTKNIGQELFGINEDSFINSAFIAQDGCEVSTTSDITAKVGKQNTIIDDVKGFDKIQEKMSGRLSRIERKLKSENNEKIKLEESIRRGPILDDTISYYENLRKEEKQKLEIKTAEMQQIERKQKLFSERQDSLAVRDNYIKLKAEKKQRAEKLTETKSFFSKKIPEDDELKENALLSHQLPALEANVENFMLTKEEATELSSLGNMFKQGIPDCMELNNAIVAHENVQDLKIQQAKYEFSQEELSLLESYKSEFSNYLPEEEEVDAQITNWRERNEKVENSDEIRREIKDIQRQKEQSTYNRQQNMQTEQNNENSVYTMNIINLNNRKQENNNAIQGFQIEIGNLIRNKDMLEQQISHAQNTKKSSANPIGIVFLALGVILVAVSFILGVPQNMDGLICLSIGIVFAVLGIVLIILKKQNRAGNNVNVLDYERQIEKIGGEIDEIEKKIRDCQSEVADFEIEEKKLNDAHRQKVIEIMARGNEPGLNEKMAEKQIELLKQKQVSVQSDISEIDTRVKDFFEKTNNAFDEKRVIYILQNLNSDVKNYKRLLKKAENRNLNRNGIAISQNEAIIKNILLRYFGENFSDESWIQLLTQLQRNTEKYHDLKQKNDDYQNAVRERVSLKRRLSDYIFSLGLEPSSDIPKQIIEIQEKLSNIQAAKREYQKAEDELQNFHRKYSNIRDILTSPIPEELEGITSLDELTQQLQIVNGEIQRLQESIRECQNSINELMNERSDIMEKEETLDHLILEIQNLEDEKWLISTTKDHMEEAKNSFSAKYMAPIEKAFYNYYAMIDPVLREEFVIDSDYNVQVKGGGQIRKVDVLSRGYQNLAGLCLRLGLLDAMYEKEEPFVVMDDPFVNFDDSKYQRAMDFLRKVSEKYQVIYFTCSRKRIG